MEPLICVVMLLQLMTNQKTWKKIIALLLRFLKGNLKIRRQRKTWFSCASSFLWNENRKWKTIISFAHFEATKSFCNKNIFSKTDKTHFGLTDKGSEVLIFKCWAIRINVCVIQFIENVQKGPPLQLISPPPFS